MKRIILLAVVAIAMASCSSPSKCSNNVGFSGYGHKTEKTLRFYGINPKKF